MTYNVFGGTLSLTQSINQIQPLSRQKIKWSKSSRCGVELCVCVCTVCLQCGFLWTVASWGGERGKVLSTRLAEQLGGRCWQWWRRWQQECGQHAWALYINLKTRGEWICQQTVDIFHCMRVQLCVMLCVVCCSLFGSLYGVEHRRSQDYLWRCTFLLPNKVTLSFLVVTLKRQSKTTKLTTPTGQISPIA